MSKLSDFDLGEQGIYPLVSTAIYEMLEAIGSPLALGISLRLRSFDLTDLPVVSPHDYLDVTSFAADAQALAFVKKASSKLCKSSEDLHAKAKNAFLELESRTAVTNASLHSPKDLCPRDRAVLYRARRIIAECLGDIDISSVWSFGPGTTLSKRGQPSHLLAKLGDTRGLSITPGAVHLMHKLCLSDKAAFEWFCSNGLLHPLSLRFTDQLKIVDYERFSTVPKDFSKLRPISIQPDCNIILQKLVGTAIRDRYDCYFKTSLRHAANEHRDLMKFASETGALSTIDLSNASDSIPFSLVRNLLPADWFRVLTDLRPNWVMFPGEDGLHSAERFSGMGCGYTFELETLMFRAISEAVLELDGLPTAFVSVFGDDIVVTSDSAPAVALALEAFGFVLNVQKTYVGSSPGFRESCGADWFNGRNVRPVYFKDFSNGIEGVYALANRVTDVARISTFSSTKPRGNTSVFARLELLMDGLKAESIDPSLILLTHYLDRRFQRAFRTVLKAIPLDLRFGGPTVLGDSVLHGLKPTLNWGPNIDIQMNGSLLEYVGNGRGFCEITGIRVKPILLPLSRLGSPFLQIVYIALGGGSEGVTPRNSSYSTRIARFMCPPDDVHWC